MTTLCIECKEQSEREEQVTEAAGRAGGFSDLGDGGEGEIKAPAEEKTSTSARTLEGPGSRRAAAKRRVTAAALALRCRYRPFVIASRRYR